MPIPDFWFSSMSTVPHSYTRNVKNKFKNNINRYVSEKFVAEIRLPIDVLRTENFNVRQQKPYEPQFIYCIQKHGNENCFNL